MRNKKAREQQTDETQIEPNEMSERKTEQNLQNVAP